MAAKIIFILLRLVVGGVFIYAGAVKAWDPQEFALAIQHYEILPHPDLVISAAIFLPWLEIVSGLAVLLRRLHLGALLVIAGLLLMFTAALGSAWGRGLDISCGCFGREERSIQTNFPAILAEELALLGGTLILLRAEWRQARRRMDRL